MYEIPWVPSRLRRFPEEMDVSVDEPRGSRSSRWAGIGEGESTEWGTIATAEYHRYGPVEIRIAPRFPPAPGRVRIGDRSRGNRRRAGRCCRRILAGAIRSGSGQMLQRRCPLPPLARNRFRRRSCRPRLELELSGLFPTELSRTFPSGVDPEGHPRSPDYRVRQPGQRHRLGSKSSVTGPRNRRFEP